MGAICGVVSFKGLKDIKKTTIEEMINSQLARGSNALGTYQTFNCLLGNSTDQKIKNLPFTKYVCQTSYTIVLDGKIYNADSLRVDLIEKGYKFTTDSEEEVILTGYIHYKNDIFNMLDGVFALGIYDGKSIVLARDKMGLKPLYYTCVEDKLIFASSLVGIFSSRLITPLIDRRGIGELIALGPMNGVNSTIYKGINYLRAGEYITYRHEVVATTYYRLPCMSIDDTYEEAVSKVRELTKKAILKRREDDRTASFLSGGLDSSIVASVLSEVNPISTYFLDYQKNDVHFKENTFQRSRDITTSRLMAQKLNSDHREFIITSSELLDSIYSASLNRGEPGMSDVDGSLYWLAKKIRQNNSTILSGECADEVFGGYPWCYRSEDSQEPTFPWIRNLDFRLSLLRDELQNEDYRHIIEEAYEKTLKDIDYLESDDPLTIFWRKITYLNLYWFGAQLLQRNDSQTMNAGLNVYCPFADVELIEYVYNLPGSYKYRQQKEKCLLRDAFKDILPQELSQRKKNPFPKTFDPGYFELVANDLKVVLEDDNSILNKIFNKDKLIALTNTNQSDEIPWFGQLMTTPQLIGYLLQLDYLAKEYSIKLDEAGN